MKMLAAPTDEETCSHELFANEPPKDVHKFRRAFSKRKKTFLGSAGLIIFVSSAFLLVLLALAALGTIICRLYRRLKRQGKTRLTPEEALELMRLSEKVKLTAGATRLTTTGCRRLGIPSVRFSDGPGGARGMLTTPHSLLEWGLVADLPFVRKKAVRQDPNKRRRRLFLQKMQRLVPGMSRLGPRTLSVCAPAGIALASSWNRSVCFKVAAIVGRDSRKKGVQVILGPTLNLTRTPTGGRNFEGFGEDPFLAGCFGISWVNGAQSIDGVGACAKHFVANELEHQRFVSDSVVRERPLRELYLRHFQMVVENTDLACIMTSYNRINGTYACMNYSLINDVLRNEWGFEGVVRSDWGGSHDTVGSIKDGTLLDLEMPGPPLVRGKKLLKAVREGLVQEAAINQHVLRLLKLTERTRGSFGPGRFSSPKKERDADNTVDDQMTLRKAIREAIVLLKNESDTLPLSKDHQVALYGPNAVNLAITGGGSVETLCPIPRTLKEELDDALDNGGDVKLFSGKHVGMETADELRFERFTIDIYDCAASIGKTVPLASFTAPTGKYLLPTVNFATWSMLSKAFFKGAQWDKAGVRISTILKPIKGASKGAKSLHTFSLAASGPARLSVDGHIVATTPLDFETNPGVWGYTCLGFGCKDVYGELELDDSIEHVVNIEWSAHRGYVANEIFREGYMTFFKGFEACPFAYHLKHKCERMTNEVLEMLAENAKNTQINILCAGRQACDETEFKDSTSMKLNDGQLELIQAVATAARESGNQSIVLINAGSPVEVSSWIDTVDAVMLVHFTGQEGAPAIAELLFGECSPSGKLCYTIPRTFEDNPTYSETGEKFPGIDGTVRFDEGLDLGYRYYDKFPQKVAFPFGFGLSYADVRLGKCYFDGDSSIALSVLRNCKSPVEFRIRVDVFNASSVEGSEVIQLYCSLEESSVERPPKELIGFQKIFVAPGQSKTVDVPFSTQYSFEYYDEATMTWTVEPGNYSIHIATSAQNIHQTLSFKIFA